jgi:hypothetical protein
MAGALEQQADGHLDRRIVIHDKYSCQSKKFPGPAGIKSTAGCEFCRILVLSQLLPRQERSGWPSKSRDKNAVIRMLPGRQIRNAAPASMIRPPRPAHAATPQGISKVQLLRYSG